LGKDGSNPEQGVQGHSGDVCLDQGRDAKPDSEQTAQRDQPQISSQQTQHVSIAQRSVKDSSVTSATKGLLNKIRSKIRLTGRGKSCSATIRAQCFIRTIFYQHVHDSADDGHAG
jgi:hypothetical protein